MRLLPFARLVRLPNVFTAFADVALGALATGLLIADPWSAVLLLLASGCLYCSGMVWNDVFDIGIDRVERPYRPLPSGQISVQTARILATSLMIAGLALAALAGVVHRRTTYQPILVAVGIVAAIFAYDGYFKKTALGPISMAFCRFLNVLLAVSVAGPTQLNVLAKLHLAAIVGVYIVGVTLFAKQEVGRSRKIVLAGAATLIGASLLLALAIPVHRPDAPVSPVFPYLIVVFGFVLGLPLAAAIREPGPKQVQRAVKTCILGLVALDAVVAVAFVGWPGLAVLLLLPPALFLGKRIYST